MAHQRNGPIGDVDFVLNEDGDIAAVRQVYTRNPVSCIADKKPAGQADIDARYYVVVKTKKRLARHGALRIT